MIEINGSKGGGQMLRSSLTLSAITGEEFRIENIRGSRPNPGLKHQHVEAVKAVARLCGAEVEGLEERSQHLEFRPGELEENSFTVNIGTAGSVTLLLDTVLPLTTQFNENFRIDVKGGTDVKWSPAIEYYRQVKLPLLRLHGFLGEMDVRETGFYPSGGGHVRLNTEPSSMQPIELMDRGELEGFKIFSKASRDLKNQNVADRQADEVERKLKNSYISVPVEKNAEYIETDSPGSSIVLKAVYENSVAGFDALGEQGKRSEEVAKEVIEAFRQFHSSEAAVERYMADQLVIFLALAGGSVKIPEVTSHVQTSLEVMRKFGREVKVERDEEVAVITAS